MAKQPEQLLKPGYAMQGMIGFDLVYLIGAKQAQRKFQAPEAWFQTVPGVAGPGMAEPDEWAAMRERDV